MAVAKNDILTVGIIGGGFMGRRHAECMTHVPEMRVGAVADPKSKALASDLGCPHFETDEDLYKSGLVDAVIIANPNAEHVSTALRANAANIPCLVEKPVATTLRELAPLIAASESGGSPILVGHHRRHHPSVVVARRMVAEGALGQLVSVTGIWASRKSDAYFEQKWRRKAGGGVIMINAVHDLDLLRHICGEIVRVKALTGRAIRGFEIADTAVVSFAFEGGALGSYTCSDAAVSPWSWDLGTQDEPAFPYNPESFCYMIAGTAASLTMPQMARHYYGGPSDWNQPIQKGYIEVEGGDSYGRQLRHFAAVVRGVVSPLVTVSDAARTIALLDAIEASARDGSEVEVNLGNVLPRGVEARTAHLSPSHP
jgi:predicted dehydrogenase